MRSKADLVEVVESFSHSMNHVGFKVDFDSLKNFVSEMVVDRVFDQFKSRILNFNLEELALLQEVIETQKQVEKIETQLDHQLEPSQHKKIRKTKH